MKIKQAFKFRLNLKKAQRSLCAQSAGCCRLVWNKALHHQKELLEEKKGVKSFSDLCKELTQWKKSPETLFLSKVHSQPLQQTLKNLDRALKEAFNKTNPKRFPRFKKKGTHDSFRYPQGFKVDETNSRVYLPKIGWVNYRQSRRIKGEPRNITISRRGSHWYVSIQTEQTITTPRHEATSIVGGDLGVAKFLTLSSGESFAPLNSFRKLEKKLTKLQRRLSKKVKGSQNWKKTKQKITNLHIRIANARHDYLHKLSHRLSKNHAVVVLEELKVANMSKSAKGTVENPGTNVRAKSGLNKSILDQGWHEFRRQISYKLEWLGGQLVLVNPKNTSRCCPECGHTTKENRKTQEKFHCVQCSYKANADFVGAVNVLRAGHAQLACGESSLEFSLKQEPAHLAMCA